MLILLFDFGVHLVVLLLCIFFLCNQSGSWVYVCVLCLLAVLRAFLNFPSVLLVCDFRFSEVHIWVELFFSCFAKLFRAMSRFWAFP